MKNKLYIFTIFLIIIFIFGTAALCNQCAKPTKIKIGEVIIKLGQEKEAEEGKEEVEETLIGQAAEEEEVPEAEEVPTAQVKQFLTAEKESSIILTRNYTASTEDSSERNDWTSSISIKITGKAKQVKVDTPDALSQYQLVEPQIEWDINKRQWTTPITDFCKNERVISGSGSKPAAELQEQFKIFTELYADTGKITIRLLKDGTYNVTGYVAVPVDVTTKSTIREDLKGESYSCGWVKVEGPPGTTNQDSMGGQIRYAAPIIGNYTLGSTKLEGSANYDDKSLIELDTSEKTLGPAVGKTWTANWTIYLPPE